MELIVKGELTITTDFGLNISPRIIELLKLVKDTGSLNIAVKQMGLSYSYCWNLLYKLNCKLQTPLIKMQRGGLGGGISELTETGNMLIQQYDKLKTDFEYFLKEKTIKLS